MHKREREREKEIEPGGEELDGTSEEVGDSSVGGSDLISDKMVDESTVAKDFVGLSESETDGEESDGSPVFLLPLHSHLLLSTQELGF